AARQRRRAAVVTAALPVPRGARIARASIGSVACDRVVGRGVRATRTIVYLHGGGYVIGSPRSHRGLAVRLSTLTEAEVVLPDYRLAPEHPHPEALDDVSAVLRGLRSGPGGPVAVVGDSAGGGLALAAAQAAVAEKRDAPAAVALICPWVDLLADVDGTRAVDPREPLLTRDGLRGWAAAYLAGADPRRPTASPARGALDGLPPTLVHSAGLDPLAPDARRLVDALRDHGVAVEHRHDDDLWHVFHLAAGLLRRADEALIGLADFLRRHSGP
ncbi:alpha/beta hydrolase, partial [Patulibacter medicamentivorans]|uniref:alpha/beta hydrolase n=1 Tax=Patulibacter medicamentivorans TaxID=1097667 RepID=UPI000682346B